MESSQYGYEHFLESFKRNFENHLESLDKYYGKIQYAYLWPSVLERELLSCGTKSFPSSIKLHMIRIYFRTYMDSLIVKVVDILFFQGEEVRGGGDERIVLCNN